MATALEKESLTVLYRGTRVLVLYSRRGTVKTCSRPSVTVSSANYLLGAPIILSIQLTAGEKPIIGSYSTVHTGNQPKKEIIRIN